MKINADNRTLPCVMPHTGGGLDHATSHEACIRFQNLNLDLGAGCAQGETIKTKNTPEVPCACTHAKRAHQGIRMLNSCSPSQSLVEYGNAKKPSMHEKKSSKMVKLDTVIQGKGSKCTKHAADAQETLAVY